MRTLWSLNMVSASTGRRGELLKVARDAFTVASKYSATLLQASWGSQGRPVSADKEVLRRMVNFVRVCMSLRSWQLHLASGSSQIHQPAAEWMKRCLHLFSGITASHWWPGLSMDGQACQADQVSRARGFFPVTDSGHAHEPVYSNAQLYGSYMTSAGCSSSLIIRDRRQLQNSGLRSQLTSTSGALCNFSQVMTLKGLAAMFGIELWDNPQLCKASVIAATSCDVQAVGHGAHDYDIAGFSPQQCGKPRDCCNACFPITAGPAASGRCVLVQEEFPLYLLPSMLQPHAREPHQQLIWLLMGICVAWGLGRHRWHHVLKLKFGGLVPGAICCMNHNLHSSYLDVPGLAPLASSSMTGWGAGMILHCAHWCLSTALGNDPAFNSTRHSDLRCWSLRAGWRDCWVAAEIEMSRAMSAGPCMSSGCRLHQEIHHWQTHRECKGMGKMADARLLCCAFDNSLIRGSGPQKVPDSLWLLPYDSHRVYTNITTDACSWSHLAPWALNMRISDTAARTWTDHSPVKYDKEQVQHTQREDRELASGGWTSCPNKLIKSHASLDMSTMLSCHEAPHAIFTLKQSRHVVPQHLQSCALDHTTTSSPGHAPHRVQDHHAPAMPMPWPLALLKSSARISMARCYSTWSHLRAKEKQRQRIRKKERGDILTAILTDIQSCSRDLRLHALHAMHPLNASHDSWWTTAWHCNSVWPGNQPTGSVHLRAELYWVD